MDGYKRVTINDCTCVCDVIFIALLMIKAFMIAALVLIVNTTAN